MEYKHSIFSHHACLAGRAWLRKMEFTLSGIEWVVAKKI